MFIFDRLRQEEWSWENQLGTDSWSVSDFEIRIEVVGEVRHLISENYEIKDSKRMAKKEVELNNS